MTFIQRVFGGSRSDGPLVGPSNMPISCACTQDFTDLYSLLGSLASGTQLLGESLTDVLAYTRTLEGLVLELRDEVSSLKARVGGI